MFKLPLIRKDSNFTITDRDGVTVFDTDGIGMQNVWNIMDLAAQAETSTKACDIAVALNVKLTGELSAAKFTARQHLDTVTAMHEQRDTIVQGLEAGIHRLQELHHHYSGLFAGAIYNDIELMRKALGAFK